MLLQVVALTLVLGAEPVQELLTKAATALEAGKGDEARKLAEQAVALAPTNATAFLLRGRVAEYQRRHKEAIADFDKVIELEPKRAEVYDHRGSERFKLGDVDGSLADFDHFLKLKPELIPHHWKRGISYYYAGKYEEGRKQFEGYQSVDDNDVENVVWRYLCMARTDGPDKARAALFKVRQDPRIPMMTLYGVFAGSAKPEEVFAAARAGNPAEAALHERLFYAHLYLGLYFEANGDGVQALEHLKEADKHVIGHYMWDVAHVHVALLSKAPKAK